MPIREKTKKTGLGNTKSSPYKDVKEDKGYKSLFFTWNNYEKTDILNLIEYFKSRSKISYIFQEELGENETPHLQGVFKSQSPIKWSTLKNKFPKCHWEQTKSWKDSIKYCSKIETRNGKMWKSDDIIIKRPIIDPLAGKELYKYQKKTIKLIEDWCDEEDRTIHWYWEPDGNVGKSALVKHLLLKYPNEILIAGGKGNDIRNLVKTHIVDEEKELRAMLFDIARSVEDFVSYEAIEQVKNGCLYSGKFEGGVCVFNKPHIIVFANFKPKTKSLSADRWNIYRIEI